MLSNLLSDLLSVGCRLNCFLTCCLLSDLLSDLLFDLLSDLLADLLFDLLADLLSTQSMQNVPLHNSLLPPPNIILKSKFNVEVLLHLGRNVFDISSRQQIQCLIHFMLFPQA